MEVTESIVILGVAESDCHAVANQMIALYLKNLGFHVINLGVCTSVECFMQTYQTYPTALAIAIGSLNGHAAEDLRDLGALKEAYQVTCPIFLGGNLAMRGSNTTEARGRLLSLGVTAIIDSPKLLVQRLEALRKERLLRKDSVQTNRTYFVAV